MKKWARWQLLSPLGPNWVESFLKAQEQFWKEWKYQNEYQVLEKHQKGLKKYKNVSRRWKSFKIAGNDVQYSESGR